MKKIKSISKILFVIILILCLIFVDSFKMLQFTNAEDTNGNSDITEVDEDVNTLDDKEETEEEVEQDNNDQDDEKTTDSNDEEIAEESEKSNQDETSVNSNTIKRVSPMSLDDTSVSIGDTITYDGLTYKVTTDTTVSWIGFENNTYSNVNLNVPSSITKDGSTFTVNAVEFNVYQDSVNNTVKSIFLPESITKIGKSSFGWPDDGYDLDDIYWSVLEEITIKGKITEIGDYAFYYCDASIDIDFSSVKHLGKETFSNSGLNKKEVEFSSLTELSDGVFQNTNIQKVILPSSI